MYNIVFSVCMLTTFEQCNMLRLGRELTVLQLAVCTVLVYLLSIKAGVKPLQLQLLKTKLFFGFLVPTEETVLYCKYLVVKCLATYLP